MAKTPNSKKFKQRPIDTRRFNTPDDNSCRDCRIGVRGSCCFRVNNLGNNPARCPRGRRCWECVNETTECECAQFGGDLNCKSPNGMWRWNGPTVECKDCPCHQNTPADLQVVTPGCSYNPGSAGASYPCCMDVWSTNVKLRDLDEAETRLYKPYDVIKKKTRSCKCGCMGIENGDLGCANSNENQLNALPSHGGDVAPVQVKFLRSHSYDRSAHSIYDKYRERFRRLYYSEREGNIQQVKWNFMMKRFAVGDADKRGINKNVRYDTKNLILRFKYAPGAEIPMNPREVDGNLMYTPSHWEKFEAGDVNDIPQDHHTIDMPFNADINQGMGSLVIPVLGNYRTKHKVLKFDVQVLDAETEKVLTTFNKDNFNKRDLVNPEKYQSFIGYQDCYYEKSACYSYETSWDCLYIVLDG